MLTNEILNIFTRFLRHVMCYLLEVPTSVSNIVKLQTSLFRNIHGGAKVNMKSAMEHVRNS